MFQVSALSLHAEPPWDIIFNEVPFTCVLLPPFLALLRPRSMFAVWSVSAVKRTKLRRVKINVHDPLQTSLGRKAQHRLEVSVGAARIAIEQKKSRRARAGTLLLPGFQMFVIVAFARGRYFCSTPSTPMAWKSASWTSARISHGSMLAFQSLSIASLLGYWKIRTRLATLSASMAMALL